ncbi:molybdopterin-dependent oxidoreductase [Ilumatobacter nonamiensis]|uniref:molybdopterin-dependent oxidoreductase n=1 Tax=Ilumatobacter nonamiensis TaxID=467093 RepID=UPI00034C9AC8|nr:molybdopterin-dependent oxidoreductase [Ilumatobacter nonamiensis]
MFALAPDSPWTRRLVGALTGLTAAAVALGVTELIAGLNRNWRSPVIDVGDRVVDNVPVWLKEFAIDQFGTNDKPVLLASIGVILAVYAMVVVTLAFTRRLAIGVVGFALFGLIGAYTAISRRVGGSFDDAIPVVIGTGAGIGAIVLAHHLLTPLLTSGDATDEPVDVEGRDEDETLPVESPTDPARATRRDLLITGGGLIGVFALVGAGTGAVGRAIRSRFSATESRANVVLPDAADPLAPIPDGVSVGVDGVSPFSTPNADFYRIDTALTVPQVPTDNYELRVTGMVDNELSFSFDDLLQRKIVEHDITLTCVSNTIGGELVGNARWLGFRLDELLEEAGVQSGADQVVGRSVDGYTCGFPLEAATDGRNAMVAFGMNGEPLPLEHGFPVRLVVPGLYGYISATKWLTEIELTTFEDFESYWVPRGYADRAPIKLMSRIDSIDGLGTLNVGPDGMAAIGGVAWAQTVGISDVQVQIDDGEWMSAELGEALNKDTWRQWAFRFEPSGTDRTRTSIRCRAVDADGVIQTDERSEPLPDGASGHHQIVVFVE